MPRLQGRIDPDGAIIRVMVTIGAADATDLYLRKQAEPPPFPTTGLIDTGATQTAIHPMIAHSLGLLPLAFAAVAAPGQAVRNALLYDVRIALGHPRFSHPLFDVQAFAVAPATPSVLVLIGRDVLDHCTLYFDGQNKLFSLWY